MKSEHYIQNNSKVKLIKCLPTWFICLCDQYVKKNICKINISNILYHTKSKIDYDFMCEIRITVQITLSYDLSIVLHFNYYRFLLVVLKMWNIMIDNNMIDLLLIINKYAITFNWKMIYLHSLFSGIRLFTIIKVGFIFQHKEIRLLMINFYGILIPIIVYLLYLGIYICF